jgi:hypothetical protein
MRNVNNEQTAYAAPVEGRMIGKAPARASTKSLLFSNYVKKDLVKKLPASSNFWKGKKASPLRSFGNREHGDCTRASQAGFQIDLERREQRRLINITDEEVVRVYYNMTSRLYGGGDTGAYEEDALSDWRKPDLTFRDIKGRPYTIDGFTRINQYNMVEVKTAIWLSGSQGVKICFNLPYSWSTTSYWDAPTGPAIGNWLPGSWGGHSMYAKDYTPEGVVLWNSWAEPDLFVTWAGIQTYSDEAHSIIDSFDSWRKRVKSTDFDSKALISDINAVSSFKFKH